MVWKQLREALDRVPGAMPEQELSIRNKGTGHLAGVAAGCVLAPADLARVTAAGPNGVADAPAWMERRLQRAWRPDPCSPGVGPGRDSASRPGTSADLEHSRPSGNGCWGLNEGVRLHSDLCVYLPL